MTTETPRKPFAIAGQGNLFDGIAYWATLLGVYVMVRGLMFYSGKEKLFDDDGNAPQGIKLQVGLAVALFTFACLAFGQTATKQFAGTASLYTYFGSTVIILILVSLMPPNRPDRWLGGLGRTEPG